LKIVGLVNGLRIFFKQLSIFIQFHMENTYRTEATEKVGGHDLFYLKLIIFFILFFCI